ncbi:MAG: hypothetical protein U9P36_14325, partial [Thermodesulfobacteriota bacterium]|nr:hypothetical protein [Thermodesulfobacteriota bacterium]
MVELRKNLKSRSFHYVLILPLAVKPNIVILTRIFHEHFAHFKVTSVNHMIKLRIIPYFKFAKCSPKASRC